MVRGVGKCCKNVTADLKLFPEAFLYNTLWKNLVGCNSIRYEVGKIVRFVASDNKQLFIGFFNSPYLIGRATYHKRMSLCLLPQKSYILSLLLVALQERSERSGGLLCIQNTMEFVKLCPPIQKSTAMRQTFSFVLTVSHKKLSSVPL